MDLSQCGVCNAESASKARPKDRPGLDSVCSSSGSTRLTYVPQGAPEEKDRKYGNARTLLDYIEGKGLEQFSPPPAS